MAWLYPLVARSNDDNAPALFACFVYIFVAGSNSAVLVYVAAANVFQTHAIEDGTRGRGNSGPDLRTWRDTHSSWVTTDAQPCPGTLALEPLRSRAARFVVQLELGIVTNFLCAQRGASRAGTSLL